MKHARRWKLSSVQRADMWGRWKAGQSLHEIGRALGKDHAVIQFLLARHGGITPGARRRSKLALTLAEREDISRGIASGSSMRVIAQRLSRACSTVSREVARHGGRAQYRASEADQQTWESALRPKLCLLATHDQLRKIVASNLMQDWSPQQISGWLKQHYPDDESLRVSHVDAVSIRERPAEVEDRAIPGHWEGDLLRGARNSHVATLVERHSRFCMLVKVPGRTRLPWWPP
jgi:transposase, IS30 family